MIVYTLASLLIPLWGWLYAATCRLGNPRARLLSRPRQPFRSHGAHVRSSRYVGQHRAAEVTP